jgi:hypothetical protein
VEFHFGGARVERVLTLLVPSAVPLTLPSANQSEELAPCAASQLVFRKRLQRLFVFGVVDVVLGHERVTVDEEQLPRYVVY